MRLTLINVLQVWKTGLKSKPEFQIIGEERSPIPHKASIDIGDNIRVISSFTLIGKTCLIAAGFGL